MIGGTSLQNYEILRREDGSPCELGRGAMGITYKARDIRSGAVVALKMIHADQLTNERTRRRFSQEVRAAAAIDHPNVARVLGGEESAADGFYAMEFIAGETLLSRLQRTGALPAGQALAIARQAALALAAAAQAGLVHRDIKPSNLMLVAGSDAVKVIDFGLAQPAAEQTPPNRGDALFGRSGFAGTLHFASPEQLEMSDLDVRSDIYSLGATLYYALTGRTPLAGSTAQVMDQHLRDAPPGESLAAHPAAVTALLDRMMAKNPAGRPPAPAALLSEIDACLAAIADEQPAAAGRPLFEAEGDTVTDVPPEVEPPTPAPGVTLAGRFELLSEYPPGEFGRTFRARNLETTDIVAVLILDRRRLPTSEAYTRLENEVTALQVVRHPAVIRVHSLEWAQPNSWVSREWVEGPSLLDAMHRAGSLPIGEALRLLTALAGGLDAVQRTGVPCPALAAQWITLVPDPTSGATVPKFNALNFSHVAPPSTLEPPFRPDAADYICTLAALAYEMLGGSLAGNSDRTFIPIRRLPAEANAILRRALHPSHGYPSPVAFVAALDDSVGAEA